MLARELPIVLRARLTWVSAALSALLVGHGFVLAIDLYAAGSRSALANRLMAREFDPLLGIVRPTLGGLYVAVSLLGPLVAVRGLAMEKERRTLGALLLQTDHPLGVVAAKSIAAFLGTSLQLLAPLVLLVAWRLVGGHLALAETCTAALGYVLYIGLVTALAVAAAAWTETLAQAATLALVVIVASWAIDASEGFAALAWLGRALEWSVTTHLAPMERGTLALGACAWILAVTTGALALAWIGVRFDLSGRRRVAMAIVAIALTGFAGAVSHRVRRGVDLTEGHRQSLPPAAVRGLQTLPGPILIEVDLDRDDARRRQLESDALAKLRLARPDIDVRMPADDRDDPSEAARNESYGRIVLRVGDTTRETRSTSRKELVTLLFEAAGQPLPDWSSEEYPGYPLVVSPGQRRLLLALAYVGLPAALLAMGRLLGVQEGR